MKQPAFSFKPTTFYLTAVAITLFSKNQSASLLVLSDYLDSSFLSFFEFPLKKKFFASNSISGIFRRSAINYHPFNERVN
ncbi:MAG TPA: hypothetical protein VE467_15360 [Chryseolinea sp.]|nr:hypothetical protein [Chryseolinea sp.]